MVIIISDKYEGFTIRVFLTFLRVYSFRFLIFSLSLASTTPSDSCNNNSSSSSSSSTAKNNVMMDVNDKPTTNSSSSSQSSSVGASGTVTNPSVTNAVFIDPSINLLPSNLITPIKLPSTGTTNATPGSSTADVTMDTSTTDKNGATSSTTTATAAPVNRSRCFNCRKKVGLTGFECRCGNVFCGQHRYAEQHSCTFDYKAHDRAILDKLNPKVTGKKVDQI